MHVARVAFVRLCKRFSIPFSSNCHRHFPFVSPVLETHFKLKIKLFHTLSISLSLSLSCAHFGMNKLVIRLFYDCSTTCSITHFSLSTKWCITSDLWTWWLRHNTMPLWHYMATPASSSVKWCWALSFHRFKFICVDFVGKFVVI